ncbi:hypothetical protein ACJX0J_024833, partial [Zea mays]
MCILSQKLYTWDIVGGHAEIIHTERMLMHLMGCDLDELNIEKPQEWYTLTKEEKIKVLDIEALDNLQRELIPDQELLHKAHFLILQSAEDVSNFVIGFKSGVKTRVTTLMDTLSTQTHMGLTRMIHLFLQNMQINGAQGEKKNCCLDL